MCLCIPPQKKSRPAAPLIFDLCRSDSVCSKLRLTGFSNILKSWATISQRFFPSHPLTTSIYLSNHDFLCHVETLDRLHARWSSRSRRIPPYIPNTPQRKQEQVSRCPRSGFRKQHSCKHVSHLLETSSPP